MFCQRRYEGRGLVVHKLVKSPHPLPSNCVAGSPKVALLFWFFSGFNLIAGRPKATFLFWFFKVVLLSICLRFASIVPPK